MRASWSVSLATVAFVVTLLCGATARAQATGDARLEPAEAELFGLINAYRAEHGLGPLTPSALLDRVAHEHSVDMAARGYFEHVSPEGRSPFDRMRAAGYPGGSMGENLAAGNADAAATLAQWRRSPPHNAALLDGDYHAAGLGRVCVPGSEYECYWTLDLGDELDPSAFALPAASSPPAAPAAAEEPPAVPAVPLPPPRARAATAATAATPPRAAPHPRAASRGAHTARRPVRRHARGHRPVIVVDIPVDAD